MNSPRTSGTLGLAVLAAFATPLAMANEEAGWYGGIGIGQSREWNHHQRISDQLAPLVTNSIDNDSRDIGYKLFAGRKLNENFAIEAGYFNLGKFGFTARTTPPGTFTGSIKLQGVNVDAVGFLPIRDKLSAFGRAGLHYTQAKDSFSGTGAVLVLNPNPSKTELNYKVGLGLQYDLSRSLALRGEWERYRVNDAVGHRGNVDMLLVGLVYTFGAGASPAPRAATPAPQPVAPVMQAPVVAPPPPAPVAAAPTPIAIKRVSFSADSLFDYDKSEVKAAGRQHLDKLAADLKGTTFDVINVTGHTDRIGSPAYNGKLSARRADSVKAYLVQSAGVPAGKISARGAGESEPVTKSGDCKGSKPTPALIACLQPDRRVEITVSGTQ